MFGNIVILLISVFVIGFSAYVFIYKKNASVASKFISILLFVVWILSIQIPNMPILKAPFTPALKGRVIDADTKKPLPNINVKIGWKTAYATAGGGGPQIYKTLAMTTDEKGEFSMPASSKQLAIYIWPFFSREYGGIRIIAYSYDYEFVKKDISADVETKLVEIPMRLVIDEKSFTQSIIDIQSELREMSSTKLSHVEKTFLMSAYNIFDKKYPNSTKDERYLSSFAFIFEEMGAPMEAVKINQKIIVKYPASIDAQIAAEENERLKKRYNLKINK